MIGWVRTSALPMIICASTLWWTRRYSCIISVPLHLFVGKSDTTYIGAFEFGHEVHPSHDLIDSIHGVTQLHVQCHLHRGSFTDWTVIGSEDMCSNCPLGQLWLVVQGLWSTDDRCFTVWTGSSRLDDQLSWCGPNAPPRIPVPVWSCGKGLQNNKAGVTIYDDRWLFHSFSLTTCLTASQEGSDLAICEFQCGISHTWTRWQRRHWIQPHGRFWTKSTCPNTRFVFFLNLQLGLPDEIDFCVV